MEDEEIENFVDYFVYAMSEYYFKAIVIRDDPYIPPRAAYFSQHGYQALLKFLREGSAAYYEGLLNSERHKLLDAASLLEESNSVIGASNWKEGFHSEFFVLCGKLTILRGFADRGAESNDIFYGTLTNLAAEAATLGILDQDYDIIRGVAIGFVNTVFKWQHMNMLDFIITVNFNPLVLPSNLKKYFKTAGRKMLTHFEANENVARMNIVIFRCILRELRLTVWTSMKRMYQYEKVGKFNMLIAVLAIHCARVGYKEGIELAFDEICFVMTSFFKKYPYLRRKILYEDLHAKPKKHKTKKIRKIQ